MNPASNLNLHPSNAAVTDLAERSSDVFPLRLFNAAALAWSGGSWGAGVSVQRWGR